MPWLGETKDTDPCVHYGRHARSLDSVFPLEMMPHSLSELVWSLFEDGYAHGSWLLSLWQNFYPIHSHPSGTPVLNRMNSLTFQGQRSQGMASVLGHGVGHPQLSPALYLQGCAVPEPHSPVLPPV